MKNPKEVAQATRAVNARIGFGIHLAVYLLVNGGLAALNLLTAPHYYWFVWVALGWGAGLALHAGLAFMAPRLAGTHQRMIAKELRKRSPANAK